MWKRDSNVPDFTELGRSALARDEALSVPPHRAQARSYGTCSIATGLRCVGKHAFAIEHDCSRLRPVFPMWKRDSIAPDFTKLGRSAIARDGALSVTPHRARARSYGTCSTAAMSRCIALGSMCAHRPQLFAAVTCVPPCGNETAPSTTSPSLVGARLRAMKRYRYRHIARERVPTTHLL